MFTPQWIPDLQGEAALRMLSVTFEVVTIRFSAIDLKESVYNGARIGDPIIPELVEDYMMAMTYGDAFPRIIVHKNGSRYVVLGGNQRCETIRRLIKDGQVPKDVSLEAYVVQTIDDLLLSCIARSANVSHGGRSKKEERLHHALYAVRSLGMRVQDAAHLFNVGNSSIRSHMRAEDARKRLAASGVNCDHIPVHTLASLAELNSSQGAQTKLGHLVAQHMPRRERVQQVLKSLKASRSDSSRLNKIKDFERELTEAAHRNGQSRARTNGATKVPQRPRRDRLIKYLDRLADFLEVGMEGHPFCRLADLQVACNADEKTVQNAWNRIKARMAKLLRSH